MTLSTEDRLDFGVLYDGKGTLVSEPPLATAIWLPGFCVGRFPMHFYPPFNLHCKRLFSPLSDGGQGARGHESPNYGVLVSSGDGSQDFYNPNHIGFRAGMISSLFMGLRNLPFVTINYSGYHKVSGFPVPSAIMFVQYSQGVTHGKPVSSKLYTRTFRLTSATARPGAEFSPDAILKDGQLVRYAGPKGVVTIAYVSSGGSLEYQLGRALAVRPAVASGRHPLSLATNVPLILSALFGGASVFFLLWPRRRASPPHPRGP